jgi:hypothetical protein
MATMPSVMENATRSGITVGASVPFDSIDDPGTYVCNWSGHLLRVPGEGLAAARHPTMNIIGPQPLFVTKISDNPYAAVNLARGLAGKLGLKANF